jgi:hypothetical protein
MLSTFSVKGIWLPLSSQACSTLELAVMCRWAWATHFVLDVGDPVDPATLDASDFTVNGIPADNVTLSNGDLTIEFIFNTSPAVPGLNTMHIPAGAFNCVTNGPVLEFTCTFGVRVLRPRPFPTPYPRP